jgi:hypothetical protein
VRGVWVDGEEGLLVWWVGDGMVEVEVGFVLGVGEVVVQETRK